MDRPDLPPRPHDGAGLPRRILETTLWLIAVAALLALFWLLVLAPPQGGGRDRTDTARLPQALADWTRTAPASAHVVLGEQPDAVARDWLAALGATGTALTWQEGQAGKPVFAPLGLTAEPVSDPRHPTRIWFAGAGIAGAEVEELILPPGKDRLVDARQDGDSEVNGADPSVRDGRGADGAAEPEEMPITRLPADGTEPDGGMIQWPGQPDAVGLRAEDTHAGAVLHDRLALKPVLVLARSSWEARFAIASLESHGWQVEMRLSLAPEREILSAREPSAITIDHYAAVLVFDDSAAPQADEIAAFVREGGGLMIFGKEAALPQWRGLLPATGTGEEVEAREFPGGGDEEAARATGASPNAALPTEGDVNAFSADEDPRAYLALSALADLAPGAAILERRGDLAAIALRRVGEGRVWQSGYADLWRWPMAAPAEGADENYREWLADWLSLVAHADRSDAAPGLREIALDDPAPMAAWIAALGPAMSDRGQHSPSPVFPARDRLIPLLFALGCLALLLHWASRRLRGAM